jgi:hypothetical protein
MGWTFRRSINLGPLRINLGKRGIGTSVGAGPLRVGRSANGRTYRTCRIPGTGISYRSSRSGGAAGGGSGCLGVMMLATGAGAALIACAMRASSWVP